MPLPKFEKYAPITIIRFFGFLSLPERAGCNQLSCRRAVHAPGGHFFDYGPGQCVTVASR